MAQMFLCNAVRLGIKPVSGEPYYDPNWDISMPSKHLLAYKNKSCFNLYSTFTSVFLL